MLYTQELSDRAIIDAVAAIAEARGVSRAQVSLAWLRHNPVVVAPLVEATKPSHLDDAVASLDIGLTDNEVARLEAPYTPRVDCQGISDERELKRISARLGYQTRGLIIFAALRMCRRHDRVARQQPTPSSSARSVGQERRMLRLVCSTRHNHSSPSLGFSLTPAGLLN
jgi:hypothetical protein